MISLDLDDAIFERTAGATELLQALCQLGELGRRQGDALDQRHSFTLTSFGLTFDAHHAITGWT